MTNPFANAIAKAAAMSGDMNEAETGGGFALPAEGVVRLRFVGYLELGEHVKKYKGEEKVKEKVKLIFEASGPNHPVGEYGPVMFEVEVVKSRNEKAALYKLFRRMSDGTDATHFAQLLGRAYLADVLHNKVGEGSDAKTYANLTDADGNYTIRGPQYVDPMTNNTVIVPVDEPTTPLRLFLWDNPDKQQWDSIFIDGMTEAREAEDGKPARPAKSKNRHQLRIQEAKNWAGSPMQELLVMGGEELDVGGVNTPERNVKEEVPGNDGAAGDPLNIAG